MTKNYHLTNFDGFKPRACDIIKDNHAHQKPEACASYVSLDTETSHNHNIEKPIGWIYQWAFTYDKTIVYGRKPSELCFSLRKIIEANECNDKRHLFVFVHNLPYDFAYLVQYLIEEFGKNYKVLAVANHKLFQIVFEDVGLCVRCSYKLSNKSLDKWSKDLGTRTRKLVGAIDYNTIRYQDTPLNRNNWRYMFGDVITLDESIQKQLELYNDTLLSMPMTSTGYVRRELRRSYKAHKGEYEEFVKSKLTVEAYRMYRQEFAGGITHGNRYLAEELIDVENDPRYKGYIIKHRDFVSHYPSQQRTRKFPCGKTFVYYDKLKNDKVFTLKQIKELSKHYYCTIQILIKDMALRDRSITLPYAQSFKFHIQYEKGMHFIEDNGRVLEMRGKSLVVLSDIDLKWIEKQYKFKYQIVKVLVCKKDYLPEFITNVIDDHFKGKSDYKNKIKDLKKQGASAEAIREAETDLMKSKNIINGIYGCSATDFGMREEIELDGIVWNTKEINDEIIQENLNRYYKSRNNFMRYEWGCATTCYARDELMHFVELIGYEHFIYADTDSIYYLSTPDIEAKIEEENKRLREFSEKHGAFIITEQGEKIYYNQFEEEKEEINKFKFLHAKCYAYEDNHNLKCVIAGVKAYNGKVTREAELGDINNLEDGFTFTKTGGTRTIYTDTPKQTITIDGHLLEVGTSAIIENVTKTLSTNYDRTNLWFMDKENIDIDIE